MTEAVTPPIASPPLKDGITPHLRKVGDLINDLNAEITALQRIEKALREAHDRLERHTGLMHVETQFIEALLKRDKTPIKVVPISQLADRVEQDLAVFTNAGVSEKAS